MEIELYGFMMNKLAMSEVALRVFLHIQFSIQMTGNPQKTCYISRRSWAKKLAISENGVRKAVRDLSENLRMIKIDPLNNGNVNLVSLTPKSEWNTEEIRRRLLKQDEPDKAQHQSADASMSEEA